MSTPEEALAEARRRARAALQAGRYADAEELQRVGARDDRSALLRLHDWAFIEVDVSKTVYSTRRWGAPITFVKRVLARLLRQYHNELAAQQTRFNLHVLEYVAQLESRVERLEERAGEDGRS